MFCKYNSRCGVVVIFHDSKGSTSQAMDLFQDTSMFVANTRPIFIVMQTYHFQ